MNQQSSDKFEVPLEAEPSVEESSYLFGGYTVAVDESSGDCSALILNEDVVDEGGEERGLAGSVKVNTHRLELEQQNISNTKKLGLSVQTNKLKVSDSSKYSTPNFSHNQQPIIKTSMHEKQRVHSSQALRSYLQKEKLGPPHDELLTPLTGTTTNKMDSPDDVYLNSPCLAENRTAGPRLLSIAKETMNPQEFDEVPNPSLTTLIETSKEQESLVDNSLDKEIVQEFTRPVLQLPTLGLGTFPRKIGGGNGLSLAARTRLKYAEDPIIEVDRSGHDCSKEIKDQVPELQLNPAPISIKPKKISLRAMLSGEIKKTEESPNEFMQKKSLSFRMRDVLGGSLTLGGLSSQDLISQNAESLKMQRKEQAKEVNFKTKYQYDKKDQLGEGQHATVFKCFKRNVIHDFGNDSDENTNDFQEDSSNFIKQGEEFAVKIVRSNDQEMLEAHTREFNIIKQLDHQNVIRGIELFRDDLKNEVYQVLTLFRGMELLDQVAATNTVLNEERTKHIFKQILTGLEYLHGEGICHRDIKPSNILLSSDLEKVCIVDFNVAKSYKDVQKPDAYEQETELVQEIEELPFSADFAMYSQQRGTLAFAAPERLGAGVYTTKIDMWAAGIVLYMLVCGNYPFENAEDLEEEMSPFQQMKDQLMPPSLEPKKVEARTDIEKLLEAITNGEEIMHRLLCSDSHANIPDECKSLILALVKNEPKERLSAKEALSDSWFSKKSLDSAFFSCSANQDKSLSQAALKKMKERHERKSWADSTFEKISMKAMNGELLKKGIDLRHQKVQKMRRLSSNMIMHDSRRLSEFVHRTNTSPNPYRKPDDDSSALMSALVAGQRHFQFDDPEEQFQISQVHEEFSQPNTFQQETNQTTGGYNTNNNSVEQDKSTLETFQRILKQQLSPNEEQKKEEPWSPGSDKNSPSLNYVRSKSFQYPTVRREFGQPDSPIQKTAEMNGVDPSQYNSMNTSIEKAQGNSDDCHSPLRFGRQHSLSRVKDVTSRPVDKIPEEKEQDELSGDTVSSDSLAYEDSESIDQETVTQTHK